LCFEANEKKISGGQIAVESSQIKVGKVGEPQKK